MSEPVDVTEHGRIDMPQDYPQDFADLDYCLTRDIYDGIHPSVKRYPDSPMRYPEFQLRTWSKVYTRLTELYPTHACRKFNQLFSPFVEACGISTDNIPDMETVSNYLKRKSDFRLRPVSTYIESRDFLAALAFRTFCCSQFVRHDDASFFTNEPDIIHDILGHTVMLCDPDFAQFSQDIGLASLGAPETSLNKISAIYSSTVEAGLCLDGTDVKAFGALLLSGAAELEHVFTDQADRRPLEVEVAGSMTAFGLDKYQDMYYVAESLENAQQVVRDYVNGLPGILDLKYNRDTNTIERQHQDKYN